MSGPDGESPDIDDPSWADDIVARAVRKAEQLPTQPSVDGETSPAESSRQPSTPDPDMRPFESAAPAPTPGAEPDADPTPSVDHEPVLATAAATTAVTDEPAADLAGDDPYPTDDGFFEGSADDYADLDGISDSYSHTIEESDEEDGGGGKQLRQLIEWVVVVVGALIVALIIKTFLVQPFYIPSGSMSPTLNKDDRILVNKQSYNLHEVNRGDVVVFSTPENFPNSDVDNLIKRVVGLEGETITFSDGRVVIDGRLLDEPYIDSGVPSVWTSGLPPGCEGETLDTSEGCTIPDGHVFVMGDNRTGSDDGRVFGPIPEDLIVGRAFLRVWPLGEIGFL